MVELFHKLRLHRNHRSTPPSHPPSLSPPLYPQPNIVPMCRDPGFPLTSAFFGLPTYSPSFPASFPVSSTFVPPSQYYNLDPSVSVRWIQQQEVGPGRAPCIQAVLGVVWEPCGVGWRQGTNSLSSMELLSGQMSKTSNSQHTSDKCLVGRQKSSAPQ